MKKFILAAIMALLAFAAPAQVDRGEKMLGVNLGYVSHNRSAVAGLSFRYAVSPWVRVVPEVACVFRHHNQDAFIVNLNAQVPFSFGTSRVDLYPLAGLTYNSWSTHNIPTESGDVTDRFDRFGANLGAGFDFRITSTLNLGIEAKYTLVKNFSALYLTASISYVF